MQYSISDLRPNNPILCIGDKTFSISLITLQIESLLKEQFCELNLIHDKINKNPLIIFDIVWMLIINKSEFKNATEFKNFIYAQAKTSEVAGGIRDAVYDSFYKSMPKVKNKAKYDELLKINQANESSKICYGIYYDKIAKRYGYSIDNFFNLTLGQLHILLTVSSDQSYEEIEMQAALQGRKMKARMKFEDVEEKEDKKLDEGAQDIFKRLQNEYKAKQGNK